MILATLGTSMVKVLVVTRCHAQYGAVHNHRDLCDSPLVSEIYRCTQNCVSSYKACYGAGVFGPAKEVPEQAKSVKDDWLRRELVAKQD